MTSKDSSKNKQNQLTKKYKSRYKKRFFSLNKDLANKKSFLGEYSHITFRMESATISKVLISEKASNSIEAEIKTMLPQYL